METESREKVFSGFIEVFESGRCVRSVLSLLRSPPPLFLILSENVSGRAEVE